MPRTPCPILYGIRGDDPTACRAVADAIDSEPIARRATFVTNQGTDVHLQDATLDAVTDDSAYRVTGTVVEASETRAGGHVFLTLEGDGATLDCAAFEPTKGFRDRVRTLSRRPNHCLWGVLMARSNWRSSPSVTSIGRSRYAGLPGLWPVDEIRRPEPGLSVSGLPDQRCRQDCASIERDSNADGTKSRRCPSSRRQTAGPWRLRCAYASVALRRKRWKYRSESPRVTLS